MSRSRGSTVSRRFSPRWMVPLVGVSSPAIMRRSVVFPHPDGPTSTTMRGLGTVRLKVLDGHDAAVEDLANVRKDEVRHDCGEGYGRSWLITPRTYAAGAPSAPPVAGRQEAKGRDDRARAELASVSRASAVERRHGRRAVFHLQNLTQRLVDDGEALVDVRFGEIERRTEAHRAHAAAHDQDAVLFHLREELGANLGARADRRRT